MTNDRKTTLCMQMLVYSFYQTKMTDEEVEKALLAFFDKETIEKAKTNLARKVIVYANP